MSNLNVYRNQVLFILACFIWSAFGGAVLAQPDTTAIQWKTPGAAKTSQVQSPEALLSIGKARHVVVQFAQPLDFGMRAHLATGGLHLLDYLGSNAYFAWADGKTNAATALTAGAVAASEIVPDWKLHPMVASGNLPAYAVFPKSYAMDKGKSKSTSDAVSEDKLAALCVLFHRDVVLEVDGIDAVMRHNGQVRDLIESINGLVAWVPVSKIRDIASEDVVQWLEPPLPPLSETNNSNRVVTEVDTLQVPPYSLDGSGVNVLVYDAGSALASHVDFSGRLTVRDSSGLSDHATHVAGTVGGDGTASGGLYRGMAPAVVIQSYGFESGGTDQWLYTNPGDIEADYSEAINTYGAMVSNNSIGTNVAWNGFPCEWEGDYGATAMLIDDIVRGSLGAPMRIVWAAGNERGGNCGDQYHLTAPPSNAKNHITVGALNSNDDSMTSFSSWGPTDDGRLKPEVSGPGCEEGDDGGVTSCSATGDTAYNSKCGTSMAAPTVTGIAALLLQEWMTQFPSDPLPRNATLKVILAHTAVDLGNPGPDYQFGYGSVRAQQSIELQQNGTVTEDTISHAEEKLFFVSVAPGTPELKATLSWDDVHGTPNTVPELVNDLDIVAISPGGGVTHYPWTLNPNVPDAAAVRIVGDHANNIEQVLVDNPTAGKWIIRVSGFMVPDGPQPFSIATTPDFSTATAAGVVLLDSAEYRCSDTAMITLSDTDVNVASGVQDTASVVISSESEAGGESVLLTETLPDSAIFRGTIPLSESDAPGVLQISEGDTITVTYIDADDGEGGVNVVCTDTSALDCTFPVVSNVQQSGLTATRLNISFETDEITTGMVRYGTDCAALTQSTNALGIRNSHTVKLSELLPLTTYFFAVEVADIVGNTIIENNGGVCYTFTTPERPDFFTEQFISGFDLQNKRLMLVPDGSPSSYAACLSTAYSFTTNPVGGAALDLGDEDFEAASLTGNASFWLYDEEYTEFYIGSNGYVTFGAPDFFGTANYNAHFGLPRVSGLLMDLDPSAGGLVSWRQTQDRAAITFNNVPPYGGGLPQRFQIELFFDGAIAITWLTTPGNASLTGISAGGGQDFDFVPSDLSNYSTCITDPLVVTPANRFFAQGCTGGPFSPLCQSYTLTNTGTGPIDWTAVINEVWLEASPANGQLAAGNSVDVSLCIGSVAAGLPQNTYSDFVQFAHAGVPVPRGRHAELAVGNVPVSPFIPAPFDGESDVFPGTMLSWESGGDTGCLTRYDVYLGTVPGELDIICEGISTAFCSAGTLTEYTTYYWRVTAKNCCTTTQGPLWSFTTGDRVEYYTEMFSGAGDLENSRIVFTPNATVDFYEVCIEPATSYPRDPANGTPVALGDDDFVSVTLSGGQFVSLYSVDYDTVYIGSNGYITFGQGDTFYLAGLSAHFSLPRISPAMTDLEPDAGGTVSWQQTVESLVVTYDDVPEWGMSNTNEFQVELFFDGTIAITHLQMDASWLSVVGLSQGNGIPADFIMEDFSERTICNGSPDCDDCVGTPGSLYEVGQNACVRVPGPVSPWSSYHWTKDGGGLEFRVSRTDCRTLELLSIDYADAGTYRCVYEDGMKAPAEYVFVLTVGENVPATNPVAIVGLCVLCIILTFLALRRRSC